MDSLLFIKIEIIILFLSWIFILYFILDKIWQIYFKVKKIVVFDDVKNQKSAINKISFVNNKNLIKEEAYKNKKISEEDKIKLKEILKKVKINFKWNNVELKCLIIEGLTIDKYNKELNLELASIYEKEENYKHAEFIYDDLRQLFPLDIEILKKLAFVSAIEEKYNKSLKIYESIYEKQKFNIEIIGILCELAFKMKKYKKSLKYIDLFLINKPRDLNKLFLKWDCIENYWTRKEAINYYKKFENLFPYNNSIKSKIIELSK